MLMPFGGPRQAPPREVLSPKKKIVLRSCLFVATIVAMVKYGNALDLPEQIKYM